MNYTNTPLKTSIIFAVLSAILLSLTSMTSFAATGSSGKIVLAALNTNKSRATKPARVIPNPLALHAASLRGDLKTVQRLVKERVNIHYTNADNETALHMAASRGHLAVVIFLIKSKAHVNARTRNNWIPLHHAVRFNRPQVANYLMAKGAPANYKTGDGLDSFDIAVGMGNAQMIDLVQRYMKRR